MYSTVSHLFLNKGLTPTAFFFKEERIRRPLTFAVCRPNCFFLQCFAVFCAYGKKLMDYGRNFYFIVSGCYRTAQVSEYLSLTGRLFPVINPCKRPVLIRPRENVRTYRCNTAAMGIQLCTLRSRLAVGVLASECRHWDRLWSNACLAHSSAATDTTATMDTMYLCITAFKAFCKTIPNFSLFNARKWSPGHVYEPMWQFPCMALSVMREVMSRVTCDRFSSIALQPHYRGVCWPAHLLHKDA